MSPSFKKILGAIVALIILFSFFGCQFNGLDEEEIGADMEKTLYRLFNAVQNENREEFKAFFADHVVSLSDFEEGCNYVFDRYEGDLVSVKLRSSGHTGKHIVSGEHIYYSYMTFIVVTSENEYRKVMGENGVYTLKSSGYVVLGNDITFISAYAGHGDGSGSVDKVFAGTLDGKGYAIKNITISGPALIEQVGGSGVIKNLAIINATHTVSNVGLLLNQNYGKVENVFVSGLMASRSVINVCYASGKISNVIVDVEKVASVDYTGAVVRNLQGTATNCYATSDTFTTIYHAATGTATNCEFQATNAELLAYFNGTLPTGFNSYWTISNGSLSFGNNVVMSAN